MSKRKKNAGGIVITPKGKPRKGAKRDPSRFVGDGKHMRGMGK